MLTPSSVPSEVGRIAIRDMRPGDAAEVLAIYQAGMDTDLASFETVAPDWDRFDAARLPEHRYVALDTDGAVVGWVAVSAVSARAVYAGVVEHSIYIDPSMHRRGVGRLLLDTLIASTQDAGIWTIQSGVFPENTASLALHRSAGFREIGIRERISRHHGLWRDVVLIERRSPRII
jgi:L-amino acid N-acyltransferase YncA